MSFLLFRSIANYSIEVYCITPPTTHWCIQRGRGVAIWHTIYKAIIATPQTFYKKGLMVYSTTDSLCSFSFFLFSDLCIYIFFLSFEQKLIQLSSVYILINPYFHTFNWHINYAKRNSGPVSSDSGLVLLNQDREGAERVLNCPLSKL